MKNANWSRQKIWNMQTTSEKRSGLIMMFDKKRVTEEQLGIFDAPLFQQLPLTTRKQ